MSRTRERLILAAILLSIAVVYFWNISANGWSNSFYAAAVQAGSQSWKAWFFGSFDPQNYVTVDKPAGGLWLMGLSARIFGFSSASMLLPEAVLAIASAALIRAAVKRLAGPRAGLLAAALFALIPVVSVMFRHSNPDAPMVFGTVVAAYFLTRALDTERSKTAARFMALAGVGIGFAFLCKTLEGLLVAPALILVYAVAAKFGWKTRLLHLTAAAGGLVLSAGWWMAAVALTPAGSRPYVDNSSDNSEWSLAVGYNGLDRLLGSDGGGMDGPGRSWPGFSGQPGLFRIFEDDQAFHVAWLIPAALIALILGFVITSRTTEVTDATGWRRVLAVLVAHYRALVANPLGVALILWGGWLVSTYVILAYMQQQFHPYYTSAMAPGIAATLAVGVVVLWQHRPEAIGRYGLAAVTLSATIMAWVLLRRIPTWYPDLRWVLLIGGLVAAVALLLPALDRNKRLRIAVATLALLVSLGGSISFTLANVSTPKVGGLSTSGPEIAGKNNKWGGGHSQDPIDPAAVKLFKDSTSRWAAATTNTRTAAPIELTANVPVMAIGGFSGRDNPITLQQFIQYAKDGTVDYFAEPADNKDQPNWHDKKHGGDDDTPRVADQIQDWVQAHFTPTTYGNLKLYDLDGPMKPGA